MKVILVENIICRLCKPILAICSPVNGFCKPFLSLQAVLSTQDKSHNSQRVSGEGGGSTRNFVSRLAAASSRGYLQWFPLSLRFSSRDFCGYSQQSS